MASKIFLVSKDGDRFEISYAAAMMSSLIETILGEKNGDDSSDSDDEHEEEIPLPKLSSEVLRKVIDFCNHHQGTKMKSIAKPLKSTNMAELVSPWDANYIDVEQELLFELVLAANYMDIKDLLDLTCAKVASMIKGKSPESIRQTFNITNDFSPQEEEAIREENAWCEDI